MTEQVLHRRFLTLRFVKQLLSRQILITVQPTYQNKQKVEQIYSVKFFLKELYEAEIIATCDDDEEVDITHEQQFNTFLDRYIAHVQYLPNEIGENGFSNTEQKYVVTLTYGAYVNRAKVDCRWNNSYFEDTKQGRQVSYEPFSRSIDLRNLIGSIRFSDVRVLVL
jgi:hypothetical protein